MCREIDFIIRWTIVDECVKILFVSFKYCSVVNTDLSGFIWFRY